MSGNLKRKRGSIKGRITVFRKHVDEFKEGSLHDGNYAQINEFKIRLEKAEALYEQFESIQEQIEDDAEDLTQELLERESFEKEYFSCIADARSTLQEYEALTSVPSTGTPTRGSPAHVPSTGSYSRENSYGVKLPQISLPTFDGNNETWLEYRDTFESLIDKNAGIDEIQKFHYLRASLAGAVAQIIHSLEFTSENYALAWALLTERYNNKRLLVHNHIQSIFNMRAFTKESSTELRKLLDDLSKHLRALDSLNQPTQHWDALLIHLVMSKLDKKTAREWESYKFQDEFPTLEELKTFLKEKANILETMESHCKPNEQKKVTFVAAQLNCYACKENHLLFRCGKFRDMTVNERLELVKRAKLCNNCLRPGHFSSNCKFGNCQRCDMKHNTMLHFDSREKTTLSLTAKVTSTAHVLLATAVVWVKDKKGRKVSCRALLDSASQSNFITEKLSKQLCTTPSEAAISIKGISRTVLNIKHKMTVMMGSRTNNYQTSVSCLIVPTICDSLPDVYIAREEIKIPDNLKLADVKFYETSDIDMLIGAELFFDLLCIGQISMGKGLPTLQKTKLGWIVSGKTNGEANQERVCNFTRTCDIQAQLQTFWELENIPNIKRMTEEERTCEDYFEKTHERRNGRFVVSIPFKDDLRNLGNSRENALKRFKNLEKNALTDTKRKMEYAAFMQEYEALGHMRKIEDETLHQGATYYMPHHGVLKEDSLTTKLRVVFDASAKSTTGVSLNDLQMKGPILQEELFSTLIRFRQGQYAVSADIEKMYRQIRIKPNEQRLQRIFWRADTTQNIAVYELATVTYGTTAASYLAIKCLQKAAENNELKYPDASKRIKEDFYVDDLLTVFDSVEGAKTTCSNISEILQQSGFNLRKWVSNEPKILKELETGKNALDVLSIGTDAKSTLGLLWRCKTDELVYKDDYKVTSKATNKRMMLSLIAQIFDPLGLLSPVTITAKQLLQELWKLDLTWDEAIPASLSQEWVKWTRELDQISNIKIPRHAFCNNPMKIEIHGFCDASEKAYGCCIYIRSMDSYNNANVQLLCGKARVAPIKTITIPKLELSGALLLTRLAQKIRNIFTIEIQKRYFWCDSTIVHAWLRHEPATLKPFVANRVGEIISTTSVEEWRYVPSPENPADLASRGVSISALTTTDLWWSGPAWLKQTESHWPQPIKNSTIDIPEKKKMQTVATVTAISNPIFDRYSSYTKLQRVIAYCLRFIHNAKNKGQRKQGTLKCEELKQAENILIKDAQAEIFTEDIESLRKNARTNNHQITKLRPFVDENGILRVGGRLGLSTFDYDKKHPVILHAKQRLAKLLLRTEHERLLHAGPQQILYSIRERIWLIGGRNIARKIVHECVRCFKVAPKAQTPMMGNLPTSRITVSLPFQICGVDFAGPFFIKQHRRRGSSKSKAYLCSFICFTTKAVHLELVSNLTSEAFLATLKRFIARRGKPTDIYSDNGTNFVGAVKEMKNVRRFFASNQQIIEIDLQHDQINWHFMPPNAPNFGGLWEASIKSAKYHIKRIIGEQLLTFEGFVTVLAQIEAVLNSRPLSPLSCDPSDYNPLTPAHFLVGRSLTSLPEKCHVNTKENRLNTYQRYQQMQQHFWSQWSKSYISELQQRTKWVKNVPVLATLGAMVLIKEDNTPTLKWQLGRISETHPGADGVVRVVSVKLPSGKVLKRPVSKVCALPLENECATT